MLNVKNKKVTVFGLGKSGLAVAKRLVSVGAKVFVTEELPLDKVLPEVISELEALGVEKEFNGHSDQAICEADLIVLSPGIHLDLSILEEARHRGIPVISEIELAYHFLKKPIIAITGTNGKTTTTTLIGELLKAHGYKVAIAGNIGFPLISVNDKDLDYIVAEVSSYQLEGISNFRPYISVILNVTPDHIERHKNLDNYAFAKAKIFKNQRASDFLVYNLDATRVRKIIPTDSNINLIPFSRKKSLDKGIFLRRGKFIVKLNKKEEELVAKRKIFLKGEHNIENCLAATIVAKICKVPAATIAKVLADFKGVEHRIEYVSNIKGVTFYNDSKGTNPDSTLVALKALAPKKTRLVILIAGGKDKGLDLSKMAKAIKKSVKQVVLIGEIRERFRDALIRLGYQDIYLEGSMEEAVARAFHVAKEGETVLLSPACSSFDMFANYEERGQVFKQAVIDLEKKVK